MLQAQCLLAVASLAGFGVTGVAARFFGGRAHDLRNPEQPAQSEMAYFHPSKHTPRGNRFRGWSLRLLALAVVFFAVFTLLVVFWHATCWAAI